MAHTAHDYPANISDGAVNEDILKDHIARTFRMSAGDGRQIFSDYQEMARKLGGEDTRTSGILNPT